MKSRMGYAGIDRFRIVAALLVVAVHTSPLLSLGVLPDFLFTRVVARLGVPFFLAATGFFLLAPGSGGQTAGLKPVLRFVRKTAVIYAASILLYLPVNFYAGHWRGVDSPGKALKMLLVDGTMYHLWYLPAAIFGILLVWVLLRYTGRKAAVGIAAALYLVGLLGDSYFGLAAASPWLDGVYRGIFTVCDYTRNGLFYAPIFLLLGAGARRREWPRARAAAGFGVSLALMLAEGLALHAAGLQRHDSMYIMLPVCVFFLMAWVSSFRGETGKALRELSLLVYILHPWVIVLLRGAASRLALTPWLVENSVVHYVVVCAVSFAVSGALLALKAAVAKPKRGRETPQRAWMEVDLEALGHNKRVLESLLPGGCRLMPAVKADAYGFGAARVCRELYRLGVRDFCVASLSEGIQLRRQGVRGGILILGYTHPADFRQIKRYRLTQTVVDYRHGLELAEKGARLPVHIKIDTGMRRLGERSEESGRLCELFALRGLDVRGVFTQLSCCDSARAEDIGYTKMQLNNFYGALDGIRRHGFAPPQIHIQCSYGILNYPGLFAHYARPGLALYGIADEACCIEKAPDLRPIFAVRARVALVKTVEEGERVGYGDAFTAAGEMRVAVVTMGYADGLPRSLSGGAGRVLLHGRYAPIVGNICMDQAIIDVSAIENAAAGDIVTVLGHCGGMEISVNDVARRAGTIPNEIVSRLGQRLQRRYAPPF